MAEEGSMMEYVSDGIRLVMANGQVEDHDPVAHDDYIITKETVVISDRWEYASDSVLEVIPYTLYKPENEPGYIRLDLNGDILNG
jgi:hypothetical protein